MEQTALKPKKKSFGQIIAQPFVNYYVHFKKGSIFTRISYVLMGFGNVARGQIGKGIVFFLSEVAFICLMVLNPKVNNTPIGAKAFKNLITLGTNAGDAFTQGDNSVLMMLFGVVTIGICGIFLAIYAANIKSSYHVDELKKAEKHIPTFKEDLYELLDSRFYLTMMVPAIVFIVIFTVLPTLFMILIAFTNYDSQHTGASLFDWVGIKNFAEIFSGSSSEIGKMFFPVLLWTFVWAFFATFSNYFLGIFLALLINKDGVKFKTLWRTVFIITIALPQFITLLAMRNILSSLGPVNSMLIKLGWISKPIEFLANASNGYIAMASVIMINIWIGVPYTMLQTSGILLNIPKDLYEAATVDGANKFQMFGHITFPYILFITTPYLISSFVGNITNFNVIYLLTTGEPKNPGYVAGKTDLLVTWLYKLTMDNSEYSMAAVISIMTFIVTASITLAFYSKSKAFKQEDSFQ